MLAGTRVSHSQAPLQFRREQGQPLRGELLNPLEEFHGVRVGRHLMPRAPVNKSQMKVLLEPEFDFFIGHLLDRFQNVQ